VPRLQNTPLPDSTAHKSAAARRSAGDGVLPLWWVWHRLCLQPRHRPVETVAARGV